MNANDWTTVPGWDAAKQEYLELDCERWIKENKIRQAGRENGERDFPPSEAVQPDEMYSKIRAWVNQRGKTCYAAVSSYLVQQRFALELEAKEGMAPIRHRVEGIRDQGIVALDDQGRDDRTSLQHKQREAREAWAALETFKATANLKRVAEYNERDTWYWWLVGIVVIEALANAMMLAGVHEYGLLGAISIMLLIGVVNAGFLGGVIGEGWRQKNSVGLLPKFAGWIMVALGATGMLLGNLLVGHFRDSMLAVAEKASQAGSLGELLVDDTFERFAKNPFGLEGMLSGLLATIGAGCCIFAASKWLNRDDAYPGYGAVHRAATEHNEEYVQEIDQRRENLNSIYTKYIEMIRDERQQVENKTGIPTLINDTAREIVRQFPMQLRQYQDHLDFIIAAYRSENEKARTTPPPRFFAKRFLIDQEVLEPPVWKGIRPHDPLDPGWPGFQQAEDAIRIAYQHAQAGYSTLEDWMETAAREGLRE